MRALATLTLLVLAVPALASFQWLTGSTCETPDKFYSAAHVAGAPPCCPAVPDLCAGGTCAPGARPDLPNIILLLADDEAYCDWSFMGPGCRGSSTGRKLPVPYMPEIDRLAVDGAVFPVGYTGASYSGPARNTIHAGGLPKDYTNPNFGKTYIAATLATAAIPYCSLGGGGKLVGSATAFGFSAFQQGRDLGKNPCTPAPCAPGCDDPPVCPPAAGLNEVFQFIDGTMVGPRVGGALDPGTVYDSSQPFYIWFGAWLPHTPHRPPTAIEGVHTRPPTDFLFSESAAMPGTPRFPFAAPAYAPLFAPRAERDLPGLYGMIYWLDDNLRQLRRHLESIQVWDPARAQVVSAWQRTVVVVLADNGADLPRAKGGFSENGYRTPVVVYDGRRPSGQGVRVETDLAHAIDLLPTFADYAGITLPRGREGRSLAPYLSATPPSAPLRNTLCGHDVKGLSPKSDRYIVPRPGAVGRCVPSTGTSCSTDGDCASGVCLLGTCGSGVLCLDQLDCPGGEDCGFRGQKWCRFGHNPVTEPAVPGPDHQPAVACAADADCIAGCPASDPIYCTCEYRQVKVYKTADGRRPLMDLFVDPDEPGLSQPLRKLGPQPGDVPNGPGTPAAHLADRLGCCLDRWWTPPGKPSAPLGNPACTACEPEWECHRCGDGVVNPNEQCDGLNLAGATCVTRGFAGGTLGCSASCTFDTSACN